MALISMHSHFRIIILLISILTFLQLASSQSGPIVALSSSEIQIILDAHNTLRSAVDAVNMPMLVWDDTLDLWVNNPDNCDFAHTTQAFRTNIGSYSYVGENLALSSGWVDIGTAISGWGAEKAQYVYGAMTLTNYEQVGHYTQEVWAATTAVGCTRMNCTATSTGGYIVACNYGPGGNYIGQYPYVVSSAVPSPSPVPTCTPTTCGSSSCGNTPDGCGGTLNCGSCSSSTATCVNNVCQACTPTQTCSGLTCGTINDGCGNTASCGTCSSGSTCQNNQCVANPVCNTCSQMGYQCGTITPTGCPTLDCGTCSSGNTCSYGTCVATPCNPACGVGGSCVNGACVCSPGYSDNGDGNGCTLIDTFPSDFTEVAPVTGATTNWVLAPVDNSGIELDMISTDSAEHELSWNNAQSFESLEASKFSAQVMFTSSSTIVGLGMRYGQGSSRPGDAIEFNVEYVSSNNSCNVRWVVVWDGSRIDYNVQGSSPGCTLGTWLTIQLYVWSANYSGESWAVSQFYIDNAVVTHSEAVRPYDMLGGAYLYTQGQSSWSNITMATQTSLRVAINNCMSSSTFAAMVATAIGIPASSVNVQNITDPNSVCTEQSGTSGKRQAVVASGTNFIFTLDSVNGISGSTGLASKFTALAQEWNPYFAQTGGITSVENMPATFGAGNVLTASQASFVDLSGAIGAGAGAGGLSTGAIVGIVIGSVVGAILAFGFAVLFVIGVVVATRRRRAAKREASSTVSTESTTHASEEFGIPVAVRAPRRGATPNIEKDLSSV